MSIRVDLEKCTGCKLCIKACPFDAIKVIDKKAIIDSVKKTGRLVIMDEEPKTGSAAAEIATIVCEEAFSNLKAPIRRVCAPDTPVPFTPVLEKLWMPDEEDLISAVVEIT